MPLLPIPYVAAEEIAGVRVTTAPVIDGKVDPAEWSGIPTVSGTMFDENTGNPGPDQSVYRIAYDDKYIYFCAQLTDREPNRIRSTAFRPNVSLWGDDFVGLSIDPFGTFADGNNFEINPSGATNVEINGGRAAKQEWLGSIEAKSRRTEGGWETEARIPWSLMRLPSAGKRDLRINFYRIYSRFDRFYTYANTNNGNVQNTPVWKGVEVPAKVDKKGIQLLPYGYGGYEKETGAILNSGLDLKYSVNDEIDLIGSVNPDFRNIENQVLSVDFSYFERLAGETRPFFLEGNDYFVTSRDSPLFTPQRIQGFDVGSKVYGKVGPRTQIAFLNTMDFGEQRATVGTIRQRFGSRTAMTVQAAQLDQRGLRNDASYVGASHGFGNVEFFGQYQSSEDTVEGPGHRINVGGNVFRNGDYAGTEYVEVSPNYMPRLGFAPRRDFRGMNAYAGTNRQYSHGAVQALEFNLGAVKWDKFNGDTYTKSFNGFISATHRNGTDVDLAFERSEFQGNKDEYNMVDVEYPNDPYRRVGINYAYGKIAGHSYRSLSPSISLRPTNRIQLTGSYQKVEHYEDSEQTIMTANYDMNISDSVSGRFIQQGKRTSWYLSFRRAGNRGAEYYVILGEPRVDFSRNFEASLILKAVFPVDWRF